jgi:hypothetical protein
MSQEICQSELQEKTQKLLQGPLKHIRAAALAAALLPLASIAAAPASAQTACPASAGACGVVFDDTNNNGIQDVGEPGIEGVKVYFFDGTDTFETETLPDGSYSYLPYFTGTISVLIPTGTQVSPPNVGNDTVDSDGIQSGAFSVAQPPTSGLTTDFGFFTPAVAGPGTGTPGYWKNHPDAWPNSVTTNGIIVGGHTYTKAQAIAALGKVGKDKTYTMFSSLVPAMLNLLIKNLDCVSSSIAAGNAWLTTYPLGSNVAGSSYAWSIGEPTHQLMDAYNNGLLCAAHRN